MIRRANEFEIAAMIGTMAIASSAICQDCQNRYVIVAPRTSTLPTRSLVESSMKSSMALTSPVIRVSTSPVLRRRWKASGRRWRCAKRAPRRLNPSVRPAVARLISAVDAEKLFTAVATTMPAAIR